MPPVPRAVLLLGSRSTVAEPVKPAAPPLLRFDRLGLTRARSTVFEGLELELYPGQTCVVAGGNRSGKTSLLAALQRQRWAGSLTGSVEFRGTRVLELADSAYRSTVLNQIAFVAGEDGAELLPTLRIRQQPQIGSMALLRASLSALGFHKPELTLSQRVRELSRGARLLVALSIALSRRPRVLFIDDVFRSCDALRTDQWLAEVGRLQKRDGLAVVACCRSGAECAALEPEHHLELPSRDPFRFNDAGPFPKGDDQPPPSHSRTKPLLRLDHLTTVRSRERGWFAKNAPVFALESLSIELWRGDMLGVIGASPSGKSTLALTLGRLLQPSFGHVALRTRDLASQRDRRLVLCFEDARQSLDPHWGVREQLEEVLSVHTPQPAHQKALSEALIAMGLSPELLSARPAQLSLSEVQLIALTRARLTSPSVLILDNALSSLESVVLERVFESLAQDCSARGSSVIVITHDLSDLHRRFNRLAVMYAGRLVEIGPSAAVAAGAYHPYARLLLTRQPHHRRRLQIMAEGNTPDASGTPSGCPYHPRCPSAETGRCDVDFPALLPVAEDQQHQVACFHPHV